MDSRFRAREPYRQHTLTKTTGRDRQWLTRKLTQYGLMPENGIEHFKKVVSGKMLWNYDNLEPTEKKMIL